jgi:pSer/pThr/pTyr-binding forkhead associated (FHA) protein
MRAQLIAEEGGATVDLGRDLTIVGRKDDCDLRIDHKSISKLHCVLVKTDGLVMLRDLGSTNGTRVNGQRVRRAALLPNDVVSFANFKYRVFLGPDLPTAPSQGHTQQLDAQELAELIRKSKQPVDAGRAPGEPMAPNHLPDLYADGEPPRQEMK